MPKQTQPARVPLTELRFFMDGSDGSLWDVKIESWPPPVDQGSLLVRVDQLIRWCRANGIEPLP